LPYFIVQPQDFNPSINTASTSCNFSGVISPKILMDNPGPGKGCLLIILDQFLMKLPLYAKKHTKRSTILISYSQANHLHYDVIFYCSRRSFTETDSITSGYIVPCATIYSFN
jgi:hypothetical protein